MLNIDPTLEDSYRKLMNVSDVTGDINHSGNILIEILDQAMIEGNLTLCVVSYITQNTPL